MNPDTTLLLNTIRESIKHESKLLPPFIEPTNTTHKMCYQIGSEVVITLNRLFSDKVLKVGQINLLCNNITEQVEEMMFISPGITLLYFDWFEQMLLAYKDLCLANELFESICNIDNYLKQINKPA